MATGTYSPLLLTTCKGLLNNEGLGINADLTANIATYTSIPIVQLFANVISASVGKNNEIPNPAFPAPGEPEFIEVTPAPTSLLQTFTAGTFPESTNTIPAGFSILTDPQPPTLLTPSPPALGDPKDRFTNQVTIQANNILGNGSARDFIVHMFAVSFVKDLTDSFVGAMEGSNTSTSPVFDDMDSLITGGITDISKSTESLGNDILNIGDVLDLENVSDYGTPEGLMRVFDKRGLFAFYSPELRSVDLSANGLSAKITEVNDGAIPLIIQKKFYQALSAIVGERLQTLLTILHVEIDGLDSAADLLDTKKVFPLSYRSLTNLTADGLRLIYVSNTSVSGRFKGLGKDFYTVMPADICDANAALRASLQQARGIQNLTSKTLANTIVTLDTNRGLDIINGFETPIPDDVTTYFNDTFAKGTAPKGRYYLSDGVGTPAGVIHNDNLELAIKMLTDLEQRGILFPLTEAYQTMYNLLTDEYGVPSPADPTVEPPAISTPTYAIISEPLPGAGSYETYYDGIVAIITDTNIIINDILTSAYFERYGEIVEQIPNTFDEDTTEFDEATTEFYSLGICNKGPFGNMANQMKRELEIFDEADVLFVETNGKRSDVLRLVGSLHKHAKDNEKLGVAEMLEKLATNTQTGQAIIGSLREGRNLYKLQTAGIGVDAVPDSVDNDEEADTISSNYSVDDIIGENNG